MRLRTKVWASIVAFALAIGIGYDAYAGNLRSAATPSTLFWFATVNADNGLSWNGTPTEVRILIDDIIYTGIPAPGEHDIFTCDFTDRCSFWAPEAVPEGTLDFGPLSEFNTGQSDSYNYNNFPIILDVTFTQYNSGSTMVSTITRGWYHQIEILEENGIVIDRLQLVGANAVAVRERERIVGQVSSNVTTDFSEGPPEVTFHGDSGIGVGVGTGVGAAAFMLNTTAHRAYQTPFIMDGDDKILIGATHWANATVMFHGRIITASGEFPTRTGLVADS